jgi:hypothetical protein
MVELGFKKGGRQDQARWYIQAVLFEHRQAKSFTTYQGQICPGDFVQATQPKR